MKVALLGCSLVLLVNTARAHRLDEYLQAVRVLVATNRIELSLDLTPGVAVVERLLAEIDQDHNGQISEAEAKSYTHRALKDLRTELDGKVLSLTAADYSFPPVFEARAGVGVIHIKATAMVETMSAGSHSLTLTNVHLPELSVYQVNALVPKNPAIKITRQVRDELQRNYRLEFAVTSPSP